MWAKMNAELRTKMAVSADATGNKAVLVDAAAEGQQAEPVEAPPAESAAAAEGQHAEPVVEAPPAPEPSKMKVADLRAALSALGLDQTGRKAALVKRLADARRPARTGGFAVLPTVLLGEVFLNLDLHERFAAARACTDFIDASRTVTETKRLCLPPKMAKRVDDATLKRLLALAVAGGALTHVVVRDAGESGLLTPGAFEPLTGCRSLQCLDIRGSRRMSEAVEQDDRMYSIVESLVPFVPSTDIGGLEPGPYEFSMLSDMQCEVGAFAGRTDDMTPFSEVYEAWAREAGLELIVDGPDDRMYDTYTFANPDTADELWQAGGRAEVHRRIEALRIARGTGHAAFSFRNLLKDHALPEEEDADFVKELYGSGLRARLERAAYWRAKALGSRCDKCEAVLVEPSDSMDPDDAAAGGVYECLKCSSILCTSCSTKCNTCTASVCRSSPECNRAWGSWFGAQVVTCVGVGCAETRCAKAFQHCHQCGQPLGDCCRSDGDEFHCQGCHQQNLDAANWGACSCGGGCGGGWGDY